MSFGVYFQPAEIEKGQLREHVIIFPLGGSQMQKDAETFGWNYATVGTDPRDYIARIREKDGLVSTRPGIEIRCEPRRVGKRVTPGSAIVTVLPARKFPETNVAQGIESRPSTPAELEQAVQDMFSDLPLNWHNSMNDAA